MSPPGREPAPPGAADGAESKALGEGAAGKGHSSSGSYSYADVSADSWSASVLRRLASEVEAVWVGDGLVELIDEWSERGAA